MKAKVALSGTRSPDRSRLIGLVDPNLLARVVAKCWSRDTSFDPDSWCPENPAWGQCAVTALVVQDYLGGSLLFGQVNGFQHYLNRLPGNIEYDLTKGQFGQIDKVSRVKQADRAYVLSYRQTLRRYGKLKSRVEAELNANTHAERTVR
jgi:hypothetical protein